MLKIQETQELKQLNTDLNNMRIEALSDIDFLRKNRNSISESEFKRRFNFIAGASKILHGEI